MSEIEIFKLANSSPHLIIFCCIL